MLEQLEATDLHHERRILQTARIAVSVVFQSRQEKTHNVPIVAKCNVLHSDHLQQEFNTLHPSFL